MQILVTGGAGFVGSHLVRWLVEQGHRVRVLDNFSMGRRSSLQPVGAAVELVEGDIRNSSTVQQAVAGCELVLHLAAMVSVVQSMEQPLEAQAINATGSINIFEAARQAGVRRVVNMSSSAVYGDSDRLPLREHEPPCPLSPYALTKLAAEHAGTLYTRSYGLEVVSLRCFNIYGPRQDPSSPYAAVVPRFIEWLRAGQPPIIFGDGLQSRDFVYVGDVVQALWRAATAPAIAGHVFNVARGEALVLRDLAALLAEIIGVAVAPVYAPPRPGEIIHSYADVRLFAELAGFRAQVGLREGLAQTVTQWEAL
ncbi:MAG: NAD-dependent epimerase/dehydratase family protein [Chloroflexaceae bacterium]|nr:NAD-dependent epimerase/dehydratase family protein [Chloroflexaceae bacterium]